MYISWVNINSVKDGAFKLFSIILFKPDPREVQTKIWGYIPINDPKKKFFIFKLNIVGITLLKANGIPPINRYIRKK